MDLLKKLTLQPSALKIMLIYLLFGGVWILFSDRLLAVVVTDTEAITTMQTYKGWFYVLVTAGLIYYLVSKREKHLCDLLRQLDIKNSKLREQIQSLTDKERHISRLMDDLQQKNEELESILYAGSHDLRSPIINLQGFNAQLHRSLAEIRTLTSACTPLCDNPQFQHLLNDTVPESLQFIRSGTERLDMLLRGLQTMGRCGREPLRLETVNAAGVVDRVRDLLKYQIEQSGAILKTGPLPDCRADADKLLQVFRNVISNAIKFRHPNRQPEITITGETVEDGVLYRIADNGIGINPAFHETVFEMFHQLNPAVEGMGIGLTVVKRLLHRMQGTITLTSPPDQGTCVCIRLPAAPESEIP